VFRTTIPKVRELFCECSGSYEFGITDFNSERVGTSNNGSAAFGASINVLSKDPEEKFYFKTDDSYGSLIPINILRK
jgi:hypothetical protein